MKAMPNLLTPEHLAEIACRYYRRMYGESSCSSRASLALHYADRCARRVNGGLEYHGVEGSTDPDFLYLNAGDTYALTVVAERGPWGDYKFSATTWGDIMEAHSE